MNTQQRNSLTKITMEYKGEVIVRYFKEINKLDLLYPNAKIIKDEYISNVANKKELDIIYTREACNIF